jgi:ADP-dependent NAD(P)H-hydrate dehydratase / NAD(P)H-hydrate epimerase
VLLNRGEQAWSGMSKLQKALYPTKTIRQCEQLAVDELGLKNDELMLRAGEAAFHTLKTHYPDVKAIAVFCGGGNNAGDGYVVARLAQQQGFFVVIHAYKPVEDLPPAANRAAIAAINAGVVCQNLDDAIDSEIELVVDALLGMGLQGHVQGPIAHAIDLINDSELPVLALDIPSGLDADTGQVLGVCINAAITSTFIAPKPGLYTLEGPDHCGKIVCHTLQLEYYITKFTPAAYQLDDQLLQGIMTPRRKNSHKGLYGHVLIIGGGPGMPGAVCLAALAALRVGAGLVSIATWPEHAGKTLPSLPEAMIYGIEDEESLLPLLAKATVCIIGPGLGESDWAQSLFNAAIAAQLPLVIDASALRMLALNPQHDDNWVLTPHPGEAAALLARSTAEVQSNRCISAELIQQQYGGCVVLKGAGSVVNAGHETYICTAGNPGMATAGMGDVLSGVIGGLLAQEIPLAEATKLGVWLHAHAADEAVTTQGERGLMASDLMPYLRRQVNRCI